jgi:hypothetical protein
MLLDAKARETRAQSPGQRSHAIIRAILLGGIIAATIDIGAACLINGRSVPFILHSIAGGLLAERSYAGGTRTAMLGLLLQEAMGILIAAMYVLAAESLTALRRRWVPWGLFYGAVIFVVMNYVVVPLSAWHVVPHFSGWKLVGNLAAMFLFGVIVAYFASRRAGTRPEAA